MLAVWAPSAWHGWLHPLAKQSLHRLIPPACVFFFVPGGEGGVPARPSHPHHGDAGVVS